MGITPQMLGVLAWFVLSVIGLWPGQRGLRCVLLALGIALLLCLGPMGEAGVIDLRSYRWHPQMQPGLGMLLINGAMLTARGWARVRTRYARNRWPRWFDLATLVILLGTAGLVHYDHTEHAAAIVDRIRATGEATPTDLSKLMLAIAHDYPAYGHAEGELSYDYRFAPGMCRGAGGPSARISASDDQNTHGSKLYTAYARNPDAYMSLYDARWAAFRGEVSSPPSDQPVGQVIVKESFTPVELQQGERNGVGLHAARRDGKAYRPGARRDLFIMVNLGPEVKGTDAGWVYGTLSPDYRHVTSVGLVTSCMSCHDSVAKGRVFGLPLTEDDTVQSAPSQPDSTTSTTQPSTSNQ